MGIYLLNSMITPIDFDSMNQATVSMRRVTVADVKEMLRNRKFESAIGHEATAQMLSQLLGVEVPMNRIAVKLRSGDIAVHFVLKGRLPEGRVITDVNEIERIGYDLVISYVL